MIGRFILAVVAMASSSAPTPKDDACRKIDAHVRGVAHAIVYVHAIGPDSMFAYDPACEDRRIEEVDFSRIDPANRDDIFYIVERSEQGRSVAYNAEIAWDADRERSVAYLIRRDAASHEIAFRRASVPTPPAAD
jgi:hypothetical protein